MPTIDFILAERRRKARMAADPDYAARFQPITAPAPPTPPAPPAPTVAPTPFAQTQAGLVFSAEQERQALAIQRANQEALVRQQQANALIIQQREQVFQQQQLDRRLAEERKVRAEERERLRQSNIAQLRVERQTAFAQLMKSGDQVRAVMFALGYGPENDAFDVRARSLGTTIQELKGARGLRATTQEALGRVLDRRVTIGREGVRGLGTAIGAARQFVQGGADIQTLLTSAFGVGSLREGEQPGISAARLQELVTQVTPTGVL
jgi:hypothetical protein